MDKFDKLNRATNDFNSRNVNRFSASTPVYGTSDYWRNYWNNRTHKTNNGAYSAKYY